MPVWTAAAKRSGDIAWESAHPVRARRTVVAARQRLALPTNGPHPVRAAQTVVAARQRLALPKALNTRHWFQV